MMAVHVGFSVLLELVAYVGPTVCRAYTPKPLVTLHQIALIAVEQRRM